MKTSKEVGPLLALSALEETQWALGRNSLSSVPWLSVALQAECINEDMLWGRILSTFVTSRSLCFDIWP
jgi:hypothetical protein